MMVSALETADGLLQVRAALAGLVKAFATDGYDLNLIALQADCVRFRIDAHEGACAECLVPQEMMAGMIRTKLPPEFATHRIEITYPSVAH